MSYVGKILVVVQVVLSLLFMAFAGAVYAVHTNWKAKYEAAQQSVANTDTELRQAREELATAKRDFETRLSEQKQTADQYQAQNVALTGQIAALREQNNLLEQQRDSQIGLAESKNAEASFRQQESERLRIENDKLQASLDSTAAELREVRDQLFTSQEAHRQLNKKYEDNLSKLAYLEEVVAKQKLETDPEVVRRQKMPPPPVEGIVTQTRANRAGRVQYVLISIGSDDGLVNGHELDVVRIVGQDQSQYLGRIRIVDVSPDTAVAEVILPAKNGIIQEGDNVTSKL